MVASYDPLYFCIVCGNFLLQSLLTESSPFFFFLISMASDFSMLFSSENQLLVLLIYGFLLHFFIFYLCSDLCDFFPSNNFGVFVAVVLPFLVALGISLGCLFDVSHFLR